MNEKYQQEVLDILASFESPDDEAEENRNKNGGSGGPLVPTNSGPKPIAPAGGLTLPIEKKQTVDAVN